jgi:hypothetical protein
VKDRGIKVPYGTREELSCVLGAAIAGERLKELLAGGGSDEELRALGANLRILESQYAHLGDDDLEELVSSAEGAEKVEVPAAQASAGSLTIQAASAMRVGELKEALRLAGQPFDGNRAVLLDRLRTLLGEGGETAPKEGDAAVVRSCPPQIDDLGLSHLRLCSG